MTPPALFPFHFRPLSSIPDQFPFLMAEEAFPLRRTAGLHIPR
jgi:hypothetical protein